MKKIAVEGVGMTPFGELWNQSLKDLALTASLVAIKDAGIEVTDLDAIFVANMLGSRVVSQSHLGSLVATELGLSVDSTRIEGACASGGLAILRGKESILSGKYRKVLVVGVEKMTDLGNGDIGSALMEAGDEEWETSFGATFPGLYALMARIYMEKYKATERDLALVSVKNHYHASLNSNAHLRNKVTVEDVLESPPVATPLKLLDCSPISDGAAAIVLSEAGFSRRDNSVYIVGSGAATDTLALSERNSFTSLSAAQKAAINAYKEAGLTPQDVDIAEVHDCFSIAEIIAMEDLGFYEKGKSLQALRRGETKLGSKLPLNTSGGLKACGHPVGATGLKQAVEITVQLRGEAKERQVKDAEIGLTHNVGSSGATCVVNIFRKDLK